MTTRSYDDPGVLGGWPRGGRTAEGPGMLYTLTVETEDAGGDRPAGRRAAVVRLRLTDPSGGQAGANQVVLGPEDRARWEGLFDAGRHVALHAGALVLDGDAPATAGQLLDRLGVYLGEVLGAGIMDALLGSKQRRTLLVQLPAPERDVLAAAFARVPWELARRRPGRPTLAERHVVVRATTARSAARDDLAGAAAGAGARGPGAESGVRVLLVFAEPPGARPVAMRRERERLLEMFHERVVPEREVEVDVLCHGVTRFCASRSRGGVGIT